MRTFGLKIIFFKGTIVSEKMERAELKQTNSTKSRTDILFHILNDFELFFQIIDAVMKWIL